LGRVIWKTTTSGQRPLQNNNIGTQAYNANFGTHCTTNNWYKDFCSGATKSKGTLLVHETLINYSILPCVMLVTFPAILHKEQTVIKEETVIHGKVNARLWVYL
jgi:hypothetical protein